MKNVLMPVVMLVGLNVSYAQQTESLRDSLKQAEITEVELFGVAKQQPVKLETITRLPLKTRDQIQSISVVSNKLTEQLGRLTVTDVAKNIPGVTQFGSYGGTKESMSMRVYSEVPFLKNGMNMDSDIRTVSILTIFQ